MQNIQKDKMNLSNGLVMNSKIMLSPLTSLFND